MHALRARLPDLWRDPLWLDRALAVVLTIGAQLDIWLGDGGGSHRPASALMATLVTASVAVRRRYPALVGTVVPVFTTVNHTLWNGPQSVEIPVAYICDLYALAVWTPPRLFAVGTALVIAVDFASSAAPGGSFEAAVPFAVVSLTVMLLVRRVVGDRERRAQVAERERDVAAREAVVEERARVARELHDVVAHHVSMMVVQAGAERRILGDENASTREVLETVEQTGRSALTEMRRLLGMLRAESDERLAPQPGLRDVPQLVGQMREAGLSVELLVDGEPHQLPAGIELSAYRIVQEALTNTLKHAGDVRATVRVTYRPDELALEITDDGAATATPVPGARHGLAGMRERVALYGGRLDAGRAPDGGFAVRVLLPIR